MPERANAQDDEDDRSDQEKLRDRPHALRARSFGRGRAEA
jgi:hypothetical protein